MPALTLPRSALDAAGLAPSRDERVRAMVDAHFDAIWRSLRRFGLTDDQADDAAQQVFVVAAAKLDAIPVASEQSFLIGTALRVASDVRRRASNRRESPEADPGVDLEGGLRPDDLVEQHHARLLLDRVLDELPFELRTVFVLFEIEELTTAEIAAALDVPTGTVASRLRRARTEFEQRVRAARLR